MHLQLIFVGRVRNAAYAEAIADYAQRIKRYLSFSIREIKDDKPGRRETAEAFCRRQAPRLGQEFSRNPGRRLLLDEHGRRLDSLEFAGFLDREISLGNNLSFLCGGPFGYDDAVRQQADECLSLSSLTFPHELARLLLVEQLYRAMTIIRNEPYHN